ncbi:tetratricopeptide repeat protein [Marinimicrobium locisalis]|uniref:tetratricopeptide repeat protein n=1 Tax=Marinimicrobium locisalis TaxID=546022 RepID=UPI0032220F93
MAKMDCQFFPGTPATWQCAQCQTFYGEHCIPAGHSGHWGRRGPACIRCNNPLSYLGNAVDAKPFWQQLPHFLAYPLHTHALIAIAVVAGLSLLLTAGLLAIAVALLISAILVKYGFAIIEQRGLGKTTPPTLSEAVGGDEDHLFLRQIALLVAMGAMAAFATGVSAPLGLLVSGFLTLAIPASTMLLAVEKSVCRAINPLALLSLMVTVGWPYLLLWFCAQVIMTGSYYATAVFSNVAEGMVLLPITMALTAYFTFVLYTMLGYVLFEYQQELGYEVEPEDDTDMDAEAFAKAKALGESAVLLSDGEYDNARRCLRKALDSVRDDVELHLQYHKLLMLLEDDESLYNHGNYLLDLMAQRAELARGVTVFLETQKRLPQFKVERPETAVKLAELLWQQGQYRAMVRLLHNFHKQHPGHPTVPKAYLLVARAFSEPLNDEVKAIAIARYVVKKYPRCAQREELDQLIQVLNQTSPAQ